MSIEKYEFENIKIKLGLAIFGEPLPSFKSPDAIQLVRSCVGLASSNNTVLLSDLAVFALSRLVEAQHNTIISERETLLQMDTINSIKRIKKNSEE